MFMNKISMSQTCLYT